MPIRNMLLGSSGKTIPFPAISTWKDIPDANRVLQLELDTLPFVDEFGKNTITNTGSVALAGSSYKGKPAADFGVAGKYLTAPYVKATMDWWTADYWIECWINVKDLASTTITASGDAHHTLLINGSYTTAVYDYWSFGPRPDGSVGFYYYNGNATKIFSAGSLIAQNEWHHIAAGFVLSTKTVYLFVDGKKVKAGNWTGTPQSSTSYPLVLGQAIGAPFKGQVQNLQICRGLCRHTDDFVPSILL